MPWNEDVMDVFGVVVGGAGAGTEVLGTVVPGTGPGASSEGVFSVVPNDTRAAAASPSVKAREEKAQS